MGRRPLVVIEYLCAPKHFLPLMHQVGVIPPISKWNIQGNEVSLLVWAIKGIFYMYILFLGCVAENKGFKSNMALLS